MAAPQIKGSSEILDIFDAFSPMSKQPNSTLGSSSKLEAKWNAVLKMEVLEGVDKRLLPEGMFGVKFDRTTSMSGQAEDIDSSGKVVERRLFVILSAVEHLHNVDFSPIIVHVLKLLISKLPDYACFAIMDNMLKPENREVYLGPLVTSPVRAAALHEEYEHILHQVMPVTTKSIISSAEEAAELILQEMGDSGSPTQKSNLPVLGSIAACVFPGVLEGLVGEEVRWGILRDYLARGWRELMKYGVGVIKLIKRLVKNKGKREEVMLKIRQEEAKHSESGTAEAHRLALRLVQEFSQTITFVELQRSANNTRSSKMKWVGVPQSEVIEAGLKLRKDEMLGGGAGSSGKIRLEGRVAVMTSLEPLQLMNYDVREKTSEEGFSTSPPPPLLLHSHTRDLREEKQQLLVEKDKEVLKRLQSKTLPVLLLSTVQTRCFLSSCLPKELRHLRLRLKFSTDVDGYNMATMIGSVKGSHWICVVATSEDCRFGVCGVDTPIQLGTSAGSSPNMFFFTLPSATESGSSSHVVYKKQAGHDQEGMLCVTKQFFGVAPAADGDGFGLFISEDMQHGSSVRGAGFDNTPLHNPKSNTIDARNFDISVVEMYELLF